MRALHCFAALTLALAPVAAGAAPLPKPEEIAEADERVLLPRLAAAIDGDESAEESLASLDRLLAELTRPTRLRGIVQFVRAGLLTQQQEELEGREAIRESIRLLPGYSGPLFFASQLYAFTDQPGPATDYLLRAIEIDPVLVNVIGDYEIGNLLRRLAEASDDRRAEALSERLLESGWSQGRSSTISSMAMRVLEARLDRGDVQGAAKMVPKLVTPSGFARLLTRKKFLPLREHVFDWAGPRLEKQWPIYLDQARAEWEVSHDLDAGLDYAQALAAAGHDATLAATFLPLFQREISAADYRLIFIAPVVATGLARLGRWDEAFDLFEHALRVWPAGESALAINLTGNRAKLLASRGEFEAAVTAFDKVLEEAARWGGEVNGGALRAIHLYRACALEQLGRTDTDMISMAIVAQRRAIEPISFVYLQLCANDLESARETFLNALKNEATRGDVIGVMQPADEEPLDSAFSRTMAERWRRLRSDKRLIAAVREYGTILSEPVNAGAPDERIPAAEGAEVY
ncbi:tetratricopeptide repeat protein [Sphingosinicella humi]|uniref:tetratricopeptide repeat protein n=1 Tax=Allosphingosinicella humi TaxID=2068657 RepID=UPI001304E391|nr:tetratricopeptide repeat protein [Sphingosinicella humi]